MLFSIITSCNQVSPSKISIRNDMPDARYGKWVNYSQQKIIKYPDFRVKFLGKTKNGFYPGTTRRLADIYNFEVRNSDELVLVKWSAGTGLMAPVSFSIGEQSFLLEMFGSSILKGGYVDEENIVIWPRKEWHCRR